VERRSGKHFGTGTALRQIPLATGGTLTLKRSGKSRRILVRLTLDQCIFWPKSKLPANAGFGIKNLKRSSGGDTPEPPQRDGATRTHLQHGYTPCAGAQAAPLLGPRSRKPFPQIKIYHYTPPPVLFRLYLPSSSLSCSLFCFPLFLLQKAILLLLSKSSWGVWRRWTGPDCAWKPWADSLLEALYTHPQML